MTNIQSPLFFDITRQEMKELEQAGSLRTQFYEKNEIIFHAGKSVHEIGIVLEGCAVVERNDLWGNKSILSSIEAGQIFAEAYALVQEPIMVDVVAVEPSQICFLNCRVFLESGFPKRPWQEKLRENLLFISAQKNLALSSRIFATSPKTIRGKLTVYFSEQAVKNGSTEFDIPFNRQQMADYLNLDRSSLSKELARMCREGMLTFHKNHFKLLSEQML